MTDLPPLPPPGAPAPLPPPPPPSPGADLGAATRRRLVVAVAIAIVLVLVGVVAGVVATSGDPASVDTGSGDGLPGSDQTVDEAVAELSDYVAEQRGRPFKEPVVVELASDDEFEARLLADFEEGEEDLEETERILRALGLVDADADIVEGLRDLLSIGVIGFYDPETAELVVRGDQVSPYTKVTIVHELVHAWDDQWLDLDRPELDDAVDETGFGFSALVEGNARRIEERYRASLSDEEQQAVAREELAFGAGVDLDLTAIPLVLVELLVAPYELGQPLVELLDDAGGEDRVDEAFADPPRTSSVVMHPERYLSGFAEVAVEPPPADGEVFDEGVFGELVLSLVLRDEIGNRAALDAVDAWAGDWYVAWDDGDRTCLRVDLASFGPERERDELREGLGEWVQGHPDASLRRVDDLLRLTACG